MLLLFLYLFFLYKCLSLYIFHHFPFGPFPPQKIQDKQSFHSKSLVGVVFFWCFISQNNPLACLEFPLFFDNILDVVKGGNKMVLIQKCQKLWFWGPSHKHNTGRKFVMVMKTSKHYNYHLVQSCANKNGQRGPNTTIKCCSVQGWCLWKQHYF